MYTLLLVSKDSIKLTLPIILYVNISIHNLFTIIDIFVAHYRLFFVIISTCLE